jgi:hypothetical protein
VVLNTNASSNYITMVLGDIINPTTIKVSFWQFENCQPKINLNNIRDCFTELKSHVNKQLIIIINKKTIINSSGTTLTYFNGSSIK